MKSFALPSVVLVLALTSLAVPAVAQAAVSPRDTTLAEMAAGLRASDEAVRRIVERAMAAVELAEARANREVALAQIRIADLERAVAAQGAEIEAWKQSEAELGIALNASLAEADRHAREASAAVMERDDARAQLAAARLELAALAEWRDTATRATAQARRALAEREELAERLSAMHAQFGLSEQAVTEARARAEALVALYGDTLAALGRENETLRASIGQFQDRIQAYQHRSGVMEESLRQEAARAASWETAIVEMRARVAEHDRVLAEERSARASERRQLADSLAWERGRAADLGRALDAERARLGDLEARHAALTESERAARAALAAGAGLTETVNAVMAERDALRIELQSTVQVLNDAATALASARAERDEARRGIAPVMPSEASQVALLEARLAARDREIAALRQALLAVSSPLSPGAVVTVPVETAPPVAATPVVIPPAPVVPPEVPAYDFDPMRGSYDDLASIPAVGPTRARAIVWYRENVGPIRGENDLKSVPGFNDDRIRLLRPFWRSKEN